MFQTTRFCTYFLKSNCNETFSDERYWWPNKPKTMTSWWHRHLPHDVILKVHYLKCLKIYIKSAIRDHRFLWDWVGIGLDISFWNRKGRVFISFPCGCLLWNKMSEFWFSERDEFVNHAKFLPHFLVEISFIKSKCCHLKWLPSLSLQLTQTDNSK